MAVPATGRSFVHRYVATGTTGVKGGHGGRSVLVFVLLFGHLHEEIPLNKKVKVVLDLVAGSAALGVSFSRILLVMADLAVCYILHPGMLLVIPGNIAENRLDGMVWFQVGAQPCPTDTYCHEHDSGTNQKFCFNSSTNQLFISRKVQLMSRTGTILKTSDNHALVATTRRGICDGCADRSKCSLDDPFTNTAEATDQLLENITALNPLKARPGDHVEFDLPGHTELSLSVLIWIVPLLGLIAGAVLGAYTHQLLSMDRDSATLLGLVAGAAAAFAVVMRIDRKAAGDERLTPVILKVLSPSTSAAPCSAASCSSCPETSTPGVT